MEGLTPQRSTESLVADGLATLAEWTHGMEWDAVPEPIRERAALVLCDDLAAIIAARNEPELVAFQDTLARSSGAVEASVFNGRAMRLDRHSAAVANGGASDWCELDEGYRKAVCHAGIYCLPALLAEAEATGANGIELLRALVLGYEITTRVARCFTWPELILHPHGSLPAISAASSVALLRRVPARDLLASICSAATMVTPGPFNHAVNGALVRNVWPGVGAWSGMRAVDWVECGIAGRPEGLHDVFAVAFGASVAAAQLTNGLGNEWSLADGYHKLHACCQYGHSAVEATLALMEQTEASDVRGIHLDTHWRGLTLNNPTPATTLAAKFSMQHILASTVLHGHAGAEAFHASTLDDPATAALRQRVTLGAWAPEPAPPNDRPARVTVELRDGTRLTCECLSARGGPDLPFAPSEIAAKAGAIVAGPYPNMPPVLEQLMRLDRDVLFTPWNETVAMMTAA